MKVYWTFNFNVCPVKYACFLNKNNKGTKMLSKLIQNLRELVKILSILASTESWQVIIFESIFGFYIDRNFICNHWLLFWIFFFWTVNYANLVLKMSRYTNIVSIGRYLVLTYIERFISTVCCFFSYICWSVNCMSWVSKFNNFFLTCTKLR